MINCNFFVQIALLGCADVPTPANLSIEEAQRKILVRFLEVAYKSYVPGRYQSLFPYLCDESTDENKPCTWKGISCDDAHAITSLRFEPLESVQALVNMRWLPPTVRDVSIHWAALYQGWSAAALPRDLRFLWLRHNVLFSAVVPPDVNLRALPTKMEELHIFDSWIGGPIAIDGLPQSMRVLRIAQHKFYAKPYVHFETLPSSLEYMSFHSIDGAKVRICGMGSLQKDCRVNTQDIFADSLLLSKYSILKNCQ